MFVKLSEHQQFTTSSSRFIPWTLLLVPVILYHFVLILPVQRSSPQWLVVYVCVYMLVCVVELPCLWAGSWDLIKSHCWKVCVCIQQLCVCVCTWAPGGPPRPRAGKTPASAPPAAPYCPMCFGFMLLLCNSYCNTLLKAAWSHQRNQNYSTLSLYTLHKPNYYYCYNYFYH